VSPSSTRVLASGQITTTDSITVELIQHDGPSAAREPDLVTITWPKRPTLTSPARFAEVAAAAMRILANANVELAALKARKRHQ
jgi:hypothetical protein